MGPEEKYELVVLVIAWATISVVYDVGINTGITCSMDSQIKYGVIMDL